MNDENQIPGVFNTEELKKNSKKLKVSIASSGTDIYAGYLSEEYLGALKTNRRRYDVFDEMLRSNPTIFMCYYAAVSQISSSKWSFQIKEAFAEDSQAQAQKEKLEAIFPPMRLNEYAKTMISVLKDGFFVAELWFKPENFEGQIKLSPQLQTILPRTVEQWATEGNKLIGIRQEAYGDNPKNVWIPIDKLVHLAIFQEANNFEGISPMRPCYGPYIRQNTNFKKVAIGNHNLAIPFLNILTTEPGSALEEEDLLNFERALKRRAKGDLSHIVFPYGFETREESSNFDPKKLYESNEAENTNIVRAWLANFLLLTRGSGSHALSESLSDFYLEGLECIAKDMETALQEQVLAPTMAINFDEECMIEVAHTPVGGKAGLKLADAINKLMTGGAIRRDDGLENYLRKKYDFPPISEEGRDPPPAPPSGPSMFSIESQKQGGRRAQKRIEQLKKVFVEDYQEGIDQLIDRKMAKVKSYLKKNNGTQKMFRIKPEDYTASPSSLVKIVRDAAAEIFENEYNDMRDQFKKRFAIKRSPKVTLANVKDQIEADVVDLVGKLDLLILSEIVSYLDTTDDYVAITGAVSKKAKKMAATVATAKSTVVPARVVNTARQAVFDEFEEEVESYTYYNPTPKVDICTYLAGKTVSAESSDARDYIPPLHYNCSTVRLVNLKNWKRNPKTQALTPNQKQMESIDIGIKSVI